MNIDRDELLRTLLNPRIALPVVGVVVIIVVLLVILSSAPDSPGGPPAGNRPAQEENDRLYRYKFQMAQRLFNSGDFKKAVTEGSIAAREDYLKQFPSGLHVKEAGEKTAVMPIKSISSMWYLCVRSVR